MLTTEPDPRLLRVAEAIADGQPVDWQGAVARDPQLACELKGLHLIGRVAEAYRAAPAGEQGTRGTTVTAPAAALPTADLLRAPAAGRWLRIMLAMLAGALLVAAFWLAIMR
jgi:hypothetical protein